MFLVTLTDDADPRVEWGSELAGALEAFRCMGPDAGKDPRPGKSEPTYKLRDKAGRKGYVRADDVDNVEVV